MGNYSPMSPSERAYVTALEEKRVSQKQDRDTYLPALERPCGTPGAIYSLVVKGKRIAVSVELPFAVEDALPQEAVEKMKQSLHDAVLPLLERFYRDVWPKTLAGKTIDDTGPLPKKWGQLFEKWIRRLWQRGGSPTLDGVTHCSNWYQLPDEYQWSHPSALDIEGYSPAAREAIVSIMKADALAAAKDQLHDR